MDLILKYSINLTPTFANELEDIYKYMVYNLRVPDIANKFNKKVKKSIFNLTYFPERFSKILISNKNNLRKLIVDNYIIIYEGDFQNGQVNILHIFYGYQNYLNLI